jgi:hypothetical protein
MNTTCLPVARTRRHRSLANLSKMGHCAPTVMQTLLDGSEPAATWLVKLVAGHAGFVNGYLVKDSVVAGHFQGNQSTIAVANE